MPQPNSDGFPVTTSGLGAFDDPTDTPTLPDPETPVPEPLWPKVSGLYVQRWRGHGPPVVNTLRLDVDRSYRQMAASGFLMVDAWNQVNWIAHVSLVAPGVYTGSIWYVDPAGFFPLRNIRIELTNAPDVYRLATVTFSAPGYQPKTVRYRFESMYFHQVQLEYDWVAGAHPVLSYQTHAHPNRPQGLVGEQLTIDTVFRRAGFDVIRTGRDGTVPIASAGTDVVWSVTELHDAMVTYWSRYSTAPQWALWTLFAGVSDQGLGGIMFDVAAGSPQRRGCAIFTDSFISQPPAGDPAPAAWAERMRFWAACHEMGHAFNLAHSFQKADVPGQFGASWIPLVSTVTSHSFMNYPQYFVGGATAYFHTFSYRFDDDELLFMRHAPERFVQMGAVAFGVNHGFQNVAPSPEPALRMELRVDRAVPTYEFLEPVVVELRITNVTDEPILVDENILKDAHHLTLLIARRGQAAHVWRPYTVGCFKPTRRVLAPGEWLAESYFISADTVGWAITEPGFYTVQAGLPDGEDYVVSNELQIRVAPARGYDDEYFAQDLWTDNVARTLAFDGSRVMAEANALLHDAVKRFSDRRLAVHAAVALAMPMCREGRVLAFNGDERRFDLVKADTKQAIRLLTAALLKDPAAAAETLGFIDYRYYMGELVALLKDAGQERRATEALATLKKTVGPAATSGTRP